MSGQTQSTPEFAVILAGGSGTRFWPKSRHKTPKQLSRIGDAERTMLEVTLGRLEGFIPAERRIIVTHHEQVEETKKIVGGRCQHFIAEPCARNTAAALALAAFEIKRLSGTDKTVMVSLHADHVIGKPDVFLETLHQAIAVARAGQLTLIGLKPKHPETGFGYIEQGERLGEHVFRVASFKEKPGLAVAEEYVNSGRFLWNSGLFVMGVGLFLRELEAHSPATYRGTTELTQNGSKAVEALDANKFAEAYQALPSIAVDHAVFEKSKQVAVVAAEFGWQDVGSWDALAPCFGTDHRGNYAAGETILIDTEHCTLDTDGPLIACIGVRDLVVVAAKGAVLVCPRNRAQDVKLVVEHLRSQERHDYL